MAEAGGSADVLTDPTPPGKKKCKDACMVGLCLIETLMAVNSSIFFKIYGSGTKFRP